MLAPGTAPRETVEGGRPRAVDRRPARGGGRSARDGAGAGDASTAGGKSRRGSRLAAIRLRC